MSTAVANPVFTFEESSHTYRDEYGIVVPSVTQILKSEGFINFDGIPFAVLERKRRIGTLVHQATALWEQGEDLNEYEMPDVVMEYAQGYFNFVNDTTFQPDLVEARSLAEVNGMRFGMTLDRRGFLYGRRAIIELKTSCDEHPAWGLQTAFYDMGLSSSVRPQHDRYGLQLGPKLPRNYRLYPYEDPGDYIVAANALANDVWKRNHKIAQYEAIPERLM